MALGHFGFQHGDLVVTHEGHVATVIGLKEPSQDRIRQFSGGNQGGKSDVICCGWGKIVEAFPIVCGLFLKIIQKCSLQFHIETFLDLSGGAPICCKGVELLDFP